jgi:hypothetical protein
MSSIQPLVINNEHTVLGVANTNGGPHTIDLSSSIAVGNSTLNSTGNSTANSASANGYTVLGGGVIMQWGSGVANSTGNSLSFPVAFPTNVYSFHVTGTQANVTVATANSTKLTVTSSAGTPTFSWMAIGR